MILTIENVLNDQTLYPHKSQWFGFGGDGEKTYENLVILDDSDKPTKKSLTDVLVIKQSEFDALEYARNRATAYDSVGNQLDQQYWDQVNGTTTWKDAVAKVKSDNPKP